MPNSEQNAQVDLVVATGWAFIQSWSNPWGPAVANGFDMMSPWAQAIYS